MSFADKEREIIRKIYPCIHLEYYVTGEYGSSNLN